MAIKYKLDIMETLSKEGYSSTRLRREKLLGESYMTQLRHGELVSWAAMNTICRLLHCQPGDILEYALYIPVPPFPEIFSSTRAL